MMQQSAFLGTGDPLAETTVKVQEQPLPSLGPSDVLVTTKVRHYPITEPRQP